MTLNFDTKRMALTLWLTGQSAAKVAHKLGVTANQVNTALKQMGFQPKTRWTSLSEQCASVIQGWSSQEIHALITLTHKGFLPKDMGRLLGRSESEIVKTLCKVEKLIEAIAAHKSQQGCRYRLGGLGKTEKFCRAKRIGDTPFCEEHYKFLLAESVADLPTKVARSWR